MKPKRLNAEVEFAVQTHIDTPFDSEMISIVLDNMPLNIALDIISEKLCIKLGQNLGDALITDFLGFYECT